MNKESKYSLIALKTGLNIKIIEDIVKIGKKNGIKKIIIFGSRARGDYRKTSDIDLAVYKEREGLFKLEIDEMVSTLLKFDIICVDKDTDKKLIENINKDGIIIYE